MATVSHAQLVDNWNLPLALQLVPPELIDPFADDADPGLDDGLPVPSDCRVPFSQWLDGCASYYRGQGGSAAEWLADRIAELADMARTLKASSPDDYEARLEVLGDSDEFLDAYAAGYNACVRDYHLPTF